MKFRLIAASLLAAACIRAQDAAPEQVVPHTQATSAQFNRIVDYLYSLIEQRPKDPTTTAGDLFYRGTSGLVRLPNPGSTGTFCFNYDVVAQVYTWSSSCGAGGGGTTPGGMTGQLQYNNAGSLAGVTVGGDGTLNTTTGALIIGKTNGVSFAPSATMDTTSAGNITSGTLPVGRLPAFSGDASTSAGASAITLATVNSNTGSCGDSTHVCQTTLDGKGRVTAAAAVAISAPNAQQPTVADTSGAANNYQFCPTGSPALVDGLTFYASFNQTNTTGSNIAYCGGSNIAIKNADASALGSGVIPPTPQRTIVMYHLTGNYWEIHTLPRQATQTEATAGVDTSTTMSPLRVANAISALSPCSSVGVFAQDCGNTNGVMAAHEPFVNPGSGRTFRVVIASGQGTLTSTGMALSATNCSLADVTVTGPNNPQQVKCTATTAGSTGSAIVRGSASLIWAGTSPKLDVGVQFSHSTNISWMVALVQDSLKASTAQLTRTSGNYTGAVVGFRYSPVLAGDTHIMCFSAPDGSTAPTQVDTALSANTNPANLRIWVDDVNNTIHFYNGGSEIAACAAQAWGGSLPVNVALNPYVGIYQTSGFSGNANAAIAYESLSANQ